VLVKGLDICQLRIYKKRLEGFPIKRRGFSLTWSLHLVYLYRVDLLGFGSCLMIKEHTIITVIIIRQS